MKRQANRYVRWNDIPRKRTAGSSGGGAGYIPSAYTPSLKSVVIASWTQSGSLYYYDLNHSMNYKVPLIQLYDSVANEYVQPTNNPQPLSTDPLNVLRIWMDHDPGANRIEAHYTGNVVISSNVLFGVSSTPALAWTQSGGRCYYDLTHNANRSLVMIALYDTINNTEIPWDDKQPQSLNVLRIWINQSSAPAANSIVVYYF